MKRFAPLSLLIAVALLLSCQDDPLPTTPDLEPDGTAAAAKGGGPPVGKTDPADPEGEIQQLLTALFPPGEQGEPKALFATIKAATARGDQADAEAGVRELLNLALDAFAEGTLQDPGGQAPPTLLEALEELIDLLFTFVGQSPPPLDLTLVQQLQGETDFAVQLVGPQGDTVVTNTGFAGVAIPDESTGSDDGSDEEVLVTIRRLDPADQPGGRCLPTGLPQLEGCYEFERSPVADFADFVTAGVCIDESTDPEWGEYLLHKYDPSSPGDGVVALDEAPAGFLDCQGFAPLAAAETGLFGTFASAGLDALRGFGERWLASPLRAANAGAGGLTLSFSDIGWAQAADLAAVSGDGQVGTAGQPLANPLVLSATGTHHDVGGAVDGARVTFEVIGDASLGGLADVDPSASPSLNLQAGSEGTTDAAGQLSVPVTLGANATGPITVRAFLAGAGASPQEFTIHVGGSAADLVVSSLTHSPQDPSDANTILFTAVVENVGPVPAGPATLEFRIGGETPGAPQTQFPVPGLQPGQTFEVDRTATLTPQNYTNTAVADMNDDVAEADENNNQTTDNYTVTASSAIFLADFNNETVGTAPTAPNVGTWTLVDEAAGTIRVRSSEGSLTGQPVVFDQDAGLGGGLDMLGEPAGTPPTSGVWDVSWKMLGQTVVGGGFTVRDASALVLAHVALASSGDIDAQVNGLTVDTGVDWTAGQHNEFRLRIDLDQSTVSLFIDGQATSSVQNAGFFQAGANGIGRIDLTLGSTSDQLFAYDDVLVEPVP